MSLLLIAGMRRSGSTVAFQIGFQLLGGQSYSLGFTEVPTLMHDREVVAKTHSYLEQLAPYVGTEDLAVVTTYRDPRDIAVSMMNFRNHTFDEVMESGQIKHAVHQQQMWEKLPGCYHARYEDFYDDLESLVVLVSKASGIYMSEEYAKHLADYLSLERNKKRAEKAGNMRPDLLAPGHIQDGSVGQWRGRLNAKQQIEIYKIAGAWMFERGYE